MKRHLPVVTVLLTLSLLFGCSAFAEENPVWWEQAEAEAKSEGYTLITISELKSMYEADKPFLLLDARPDYEYNRGHLPDAVNLEFHLGERLSLDPVKRKRFEQLLGPDKERTIVIYCRSFR